jgi:putative transposase
MRIRNYKYKLKPNAKFRTGCEETLAVCRDLYNSALQQRIWGWHQQTRTITWVEQCRELTDARALPEVGGVLRSFQVEVLRKLDRAFKSFFRRVKHKQNPGFPRFKGFDRYDSFTVIDARKFRVEGDKLIVQRLGSVRLRLSRPLVGKARQLTIKREHDGWYAIIACEAETNETLPRTGESVGVDVGLESFASLSTGEQIENPRYFRKSETGLAEANRRLAVKKRGSLSRRKAKRIVQGWYAKIKRQRDWFHWQESCSLVKRFDRIAVEDLNVKGLVKSNLAKSIHDAGWANFINKLLVKAEDAGREVIKVSPKHTSQECSNCGKRIKKELGERWHSCECGLELHRDHNAALNILARAGPVSASKRIFGEFPARKLTNQ